ncbi:hypothetical protein IU469_03030 [Nocardia puris]|uniref:hypothetical protein n=1 Tax=Nocardia puris TaxID=208602 RepID=UPI001895D94E|nr:hypothetical protein [Nocardia puris]MBF6364701.1 hypothetical protein [Nocardia puris]
MNDNIANLGVKCAAMNAAASRGILAMQGIGMSSVGDFGFGTPVQSAPAHLPLPLIQDEPKGGWRPVFGAPAGDFAREAGYEPALLPISADAGVQAARLRTAHPATLLRDRHPCRTR